jgi:GNAT superfamily N-acetyltransferase
VIMVRRVGSETWQEWRSLRLKALLDAPAAFASGYDMWADAPEQQWRARLALRDSVALIVEVDHRHAGMVAAALTEDANVVELSSMWVEPRARGTGVADHLLDHIERWASELGASRIRLCVLPGNPAASNFYRKRGFRVDDLTPVLTGAVAEGVQSMTFDLVAR